MAPIKYNGMKVFMNDLKNTWPFAVGFGITFAVILKMQLGFTEYTNPALAHH